MTERRRVSIVSVIGPCYLLSGMAFADCTGIEDAAQKMRAQQMISLLSRLVADSPPVQRIQSSGNSEARQQLETARGEALEAERLLGEGCAEEAAELASQGLKTARSVFNKVKAISTDGRPEYAALHRRTVSFLESLSQQPTERQALGEDDLVGMRRQVTRAEHLAADEKYSEATALLDPVADRLQRRLVDVLRDKTVVYEKAFANEEEEYTYYAEQLRGYEILLRQNQLEPPHSSKDAFTKAIQNAQQLRSSARELAAKKRWAEALSTMHEALADYERALRLTGIYY